MPPVAKFNNVTQKMTWKVSEKKLWALVKEIIRHVCQDYILAYHTMNEIECKNSNIEICTVNYTHRERERERERDENEEGYKMELE